MKRIWLYLFIGLIGSLFFACSDDDGTEQRSAERLKVTKNLVTKSVDDALIVFTGEDIVSYNMVTGELVLRNITGSDILKQMDELCKSFSFYLDDQVLFESLLVSGISSFIYDELTLYSGSDDDIYLTFGYPWGDEVHMSDHEYHQQQREENAQKIQAEWDQFINYLKAEGKIIAEESEETDSPEDDIVNEPDTTDVD